MLVDIARTILLEELEANAKLTTKERAKKLQTIPGVSHVSRYNMTCGISTYCENLFAAMDGKIRCCVLSDKNRNRENPSCEEGVIPCFDAENEGSYDGIVNEAISQGNQIIHFQHEFGIFHNDDAFIGILKFLRQCGFKVITTYHTVPVSKSRDKIFDASDLNVVHTEMAAYRLYAAGINNVTVIQHGTEQPTLLNKNECREFAKQYIDLEIDDLLVTSVGFISSNKMQIETLQSVKIARERNPKIKFLLIGSTGRRTYDIDYLPGLLELQDDGIKIVNKFVSREDIAKFMTASDFGVYNYVQTEYSVSGMAHLVLSYGIPTVSSNSRILEELTPDTSLKSAGIEQMASLICELAADEDLRKQLSANATAKGISTLWDKTARTHIEVYRNVGGWST
jgi:glycosyltransferase involved in cell wall biosynthesis